MTEQWRIFLLGGLRAEQGGRTITRFKSQKIASLFAYLAYHLRQTHSREFLIELIRPESCSLQAGPCRIRIRMTSWRRRVKAVFVSTMLAESREVWNSVPNLANRWQNATD